MRFQDSSGARKNMLKLRMIGINDYSVLEAGQRIGRCKPKSVPALTEFLGHFTIILSSSRRHA